MTGTKRTKEDPCYHRHHDNTANEPIRCSHCKLLYADDLSFRDHVLDCQRKAMRGTMPTSLKQKVPA